MKIGTNHIFILFFIVNFIFSKAFIMSEGSMYQGIICKIISAGGEYRKIYARSIILWTNVLCGFKNRKLDK